ncbi:MAG TPA: hypothetical protein VHX63_03790 [Acidobacteriaceae bacterium]|jgi:polysaccharide chain length determinant protein (PEP-CTERM system associated)|nr:hypothetical protein [Acidobacteriaceae bacterium]
MNRELPTSYDGIRALLQRRWKLFIFPVVLVPIVVFLIGLKLPKEYRSETLILVEPQKIPSDYVKATVTTDVTSRLQTIREEVMSRTRLITVIHELNLGHGSLTPEQLDDLVRKMRKNITVDIIADPRADHPGVGSFKISYLANTPKGAQLVTQRIAQLFIQEDLKQLNQQAFGTDQFMSAQLDQARQAMAEQDARIQAFKSAHMGSLPEQEQANLQLISQQQALMESNDEAISRASQQKAYLDSLMSIGIDGKASPLPPQQTPLQRQLQAAQTQLAVAQRTYTDQYPDVIRLKREVASLTAQVAHERKQPVAAMSATGPTIADQAKSQLVSLNQEIQQRTERQKLIEAQIQQLQNRVEALPAVEQQFQELNQVYQTLKDNYDSLAKKQQSASMADELEKQNDSEQFRFLDPPSLPTRAYFPNMILLNLAGIAAGLLVGIAAALIAELTDPTIHSREEVTTYLQLPCLATIPLLSATNNGSPLSGKTLRI